MCCLCKVSTWFLLHYSLYFFMFGNFNNLKRKKKSSHTVVCLASCLYTKCFLYLHIFLHLEQLMGYPPNKLLGGKKDEQRRRTFYLPFPVLWWCFFVCLLCFEKRWKWKGLMKSSENWRSPALPWVDWAWNRGPLTSGTAGWGPAGMETGSPG